MAGRSLRPGQLRPDVGQPPPRAAVARHLADPMNLEDWSPMEVQPFALDVPAAALDDLRDRLHRTRWPERETVGDWTQGVPLAVLSDLCRYWADEYDWPARQAAINRFAQYRATVDGLGIHFLHVPSPHEGA